MNVRDRLAQFGNCRPVVFGDVMLDEYIHGRATRISQEAPVMVVRQERVTNVPGGAANVAMNLRAMGAQVRLIGFAGRDDAGSDLTAALSKVGIGSDGIVEHYNRKTTRKTRVMANHSQQVLRIDVEEETPAVPEVAEAMLEKLVTALDEKSDLILLSDYRKGAVAGPIIERIVRLGRERGVPVVANAKPNSLPHYAGADLVSLNRFEASAALGKEFPLSDEEAGAAAAELGERYDIGTLLVTLGGSGMVAAGAEGLVQVPAVRVELYDEAGAGDTVIATLALCFGTGGIQRQALELATYTAAAVVRKIGVAVPSPEDLAQIGEALQSR